jgi:lysozyme family protein
MNWYRLVERLRYPDRFGYAVAVVLAHEGGYSDDKDDKGGPTAYGISTKFLQENRLNYSPKDITESLAKSIYKKYFWDKYSYNELKSLLIATKVFDCSVNMGSSEAHMLLQRAINNIADEKVEVDGILGINTLNAANKCNDNLLLQNIRFEARRFYLNLINERPEDAVFKNGWLARADS